jgi:hypothetical protein
VRDSGNPELGIGSPVCASSPIPRDKALNKFVNANTQLTTFPIGDLSTLNPLCDLNTYRLPGRAHTQNIWRVWPVAPVRDTVRRKKRGGG